MARTLASARAKLEAEPVWEELAPILEDIRDIIMQAYLQMDAGFGAYLYQWMSP